MIWRMETGINRHFLKTGIMEIIIEKEYQGNLMADYKEIIEKVIEQALDYEACPYEIQVNVLLTDDEEIHAINREQRGIDRLTDVLSFPMVSYTAPADFSDLEEREPADFHPETGELILGDIVLSVDRMKAQAAEYGHAATRELAFLVAHSMLHLMGYDHMEDEERLMMEAKQEAILNRCGYTRDFKEEADRRPEDTPLKGKMP